MELKNIFIFDDFILDINESLSDSFYKDLKNWIQGGAGLFREKNVFPESIFLYLKKLGYKKTGKIYRTIIIYPFIITIEQESEYYDLYNFLFDKWDEHNKSLEFLDDIMKPHVEREREVVSRLSPSFKILWIKNYANGDKNPDISKINIGEIRNKIISSDSGKLLSFTNNINSAEYFSEDHFIVNNYDNYRLEQSKLPNNEQDSFEEQNNFFYKFEKENAENKKRANRILLKYSKPFSARINKN